MTAALTRLAAAAGIAVGLSGTALAAGLYTPGSWSAMASDRAAQQVGDSLTVLIYEASIVQNTAQTGSQRDAQIAGQLNAGSSTNKSAQIGLNGKFDNSALASRSGKVVAQITVIVDNILPNGDLHVSGQQLLNVSGEKTKIGVRGRVRRQDVTPDNMVLSTRLADATIDYNGQGFVSRGSQPGLVGKVFSWLGLP